jgi:hypothetical protein
MSLLYILYICLYLFCICYIYIYVFSVPLYMVYENKDDWLTSDAAFNIGFFPFTQIKWAAECYLCYCFYIRISPMHVPAIHVFSVYIKISYPLLHIDTHIFRTLIWMHMNIFYMHFRVRKINNSRVSKWKWLSLK